MGAAILGPVELNHQLKLRSTTFLQARTGSFCIMTVDFKRGAHLSLITAQWY
jgi:hypothetical protein